MTCRHNPKASRLSRCAMGSRYAGWEECLGRLGRRPRPTRNDAPPTSSQHVRARGRHGTGPSTTEQRVERRATMKRFLAQAQTPNGEIDLVDRALPPPVERLSKLFERCPQRFAEVASDSNSCKTPFVPETHQTGADVAKAVARSKKAPVRRPWSKDDVRLLKGMARKEPAAKIAKALKRTEGATRQKAKSVGISLSMARKKRAPAKKR